MRLRLGARVWTDSLLTSSHEGSGGRDEQDERSSECLGEAAGGALLGPTLVWLGESADRTLLPRPPPEKQLPRFFDGGREGGDAALVPCTSLNVLVAVMVCLLALQLRCRSKLRVACRTGRRVERASVKPSASRAEATTSPSPITVSPLTRRRSVATRRMCINRPGSLFATSRSPERGRRSRLRTWVRGGERGGWSRGAGSG